MPGAQRVSDMWGETSAQRLMPLTLISGALNQLKHKQLLVAEALEPAGGATAKRPQQCTCQAAAACAHFTASSGFTNLNTGVAAGPPAAPAVLKSCIFCCRRGRGARQEAASLVGDVNAARAAPRLHEQRVQALRHALQREAGQRGGQLVLRQALRSEAAHVMRRYTHTCSRLRACSCSLHTASTASSSELPAATNATAEDGPPPLMVPAAAPAAAAAAAAASAPCLHALRADYAGGVAQRKQARQDGHKKGGQRQRFEMRGRCPCSPHGQATMRGHHSTKLLCNSTRAYVRFTSSQAVAAERSLIRCKWCALTVSPTVGVSGWPFSRDSSGIMPGAVPGMSISMMGFALPRGRSLRVGIDAAAAAAAVVPSSALASSLGKVSTGCTAPLDLSSNFTR